MQIQSANICPFCKRSDTSGAIDAAEHWFENGKLVLYMKCQNKECGKAHLAYYDAKYLYSVVEESEE